ncbi:MAG TPA: vWA domain-containing protein [Clostridiales bacterium]|mgnify:CR=1 FL=1|nr:vWA domain-containing protein [Clostridiales bacterium]HQK74436.1 vWA domain-containing protein [Clostridiales bacterium]
MNCGEDEIRRRLYDVIPAGTLQMQQFLKLFAIRFTQTETQSAAVNCRARPELILNKSFIDEYCKTDEHLFMLVMHELYHIILGHTMLFKRVTAIDNIALDAVINAMLCREFPQERYTSFFSQINDAGSMPSALLRPPAPETPVEAKQTMDMLYNTNTGTYYDVYRLLINNFNIKQGNGPGIRNRKIKGRGKGSGNKPFVLLGDHYDKNDEVSGNPMLKDIIERMAEKWPSPPDTMAGRDLGGKAEDKKIEYEIKKQTERAKMLRLLRMSGIAGGVDAVNKLSVRMQQVTATTFLPNFCDRSLAAKMELQEDVLLYSRQMQMPLPERETLYTTYVYLDVSGSVLDALNKFVPLLVKPTVEHRCRVFAFSTEVYPVSVEQMKKGEFKSTGGTDINCVFEHFFSEQKKKRKRKILVLTDGDTGTTGQEHAERIAKEKVQVYCGLFGNSTKDNLKNVVKVFEEFSQ